MLRYADCDYGHVLPASFSRQRLNGVKKKQIFLEKNKKCLKIVASLIKML